MHLQAGPEFVWGFVIAVSTKYDNSRDDRPCSNICNSQNSFKEGTISSYVKNNYLCEYATNGDWQVNTFFGGDPLWDSQNCPAWSTCCVLNKKHLSFIKLCHRQGLMTYNLSSV